MIGVGEHERRRLVDRRRASAGRRIGTRTGVQRKGVEPVGFRLGGHSLRPNGKPFELPGKGERTASGRQSGSAAVQTSPLELVGPAPTPRGRHCLRRSFADDIARHDEQLRAALSRDRLDRAGDACRRVQSRNSEAATGANTGGDGAEGDAAGRRRQRGLRRPDAEFAVGQHPGPRLGLSRQAPLHRRRAGQGGPGAVPDGSEAVCRPGRPGEGRLAAQPGGRRRRQVESRADEAARRAERAVAEGPRRRTGTVRAGGRSRRAV